MPVTAKKHVRAMRGGAQSHLIEASDGYFYVVKFRNNPQHHRILVNELIAAEILSFLHITSPHYDLVQVSEEFLRENPQINIRLGSRIVPPDPGWAFGSQHPGDPALTAVYDFVPDPLLARVHNRLDFLAILAVDKWTGNTDGRQSIFLRAKLRDWIPAAKGSRKLGFIALMIDNGFIFNGPHWNFTESAVQGLYPHHVVYDSVTSLQDFEPWLESISNFPCEVLNQALRRTPPAWIDNEEEELERMLELLIRRRKRIRELVLQSRGIFPNWNGQ